VLKDSESTCTLLGLKEEHLALVLKGMLAACSPGGTAYPFFERNGRLRTGDSPEADIQKGAVACKTGTAEFGASNAQGYRTTHGWWIGIVEPHILADSGPGGQLRSHWLKLVEQNGYPERLALTILVESDETTPFREGSRDAAPVGKAIIEWLEGVASPQLDP
jgi:cell division protein FtsI/penicillin-binding protein 2